MTWLHYSNNPDLQITKHYNKQLLTSMKPNGFWLSYNDEWLEWCKDEGFWTFGPNEYYVYEFEFKPTAKILTIQSIDDLRDFIINYNLLDLKKINELSEKDIYEKMLNGGGVIDWRRVIAKYDIIAFINYASMKTALYRKIGEIPFPLVVWFMTIDVSSACVFNTDALVLKNKEFVQSDAKCEQSPE